VERRIGVLAAVVAALWGGAAWGQTDAPSGGRETLVAMRASVDLGGARALTVADVAEVSGPEAERLGAIEVVPSASVSSAARGVLVVDAQRVRGALERAGVNWGRVTLRTVTCVVRTTAKEPLGEPVARAGAGRDNAGGAGRNEPALVDRSRPDTVRVAVADRLAQMLGVGPEGIKLAFKAQDERVLEQSTAGRAVDVQPGAGAESGRIPVRVQMYEGERMVHSSTVAVEVLVRRSAVIARESIDRRETIREAAVLVEDRWMNPADGAPVGLASVIGMNARSKVAAGEVITASDVEAPVVVRRGEQVVVNCLSGGIVVQIKARAVREGRDGELVEFTPLGSKRTFSARMSGRGRAVMDMGGSRLE
jgi:flagella basal body P-ring formation protein FlgA